MLTPIICPSPVRLVRKPVIPSIFAQRFLTLQTSRNLRRAALRHAIPATSLSTFDHPYPAARSSGLERHRFQSSATRLSLKDKLNQKGLVTVITGELSGSWTAFILLSDLTLITLQEDPAGLDFTSERQLQVLEVTSQYWISLSLRSLFSL